jgi:hypothetical protein
MSIAKILLASVLALAAAACGQLGQGKAAPPAEGDASAPASDASGGDGKPEGADAGKPETPAQAPAGAQPDKPS